VEPCVELPIGSSYPSGHSCAGAAFAAVWGEILPEYRPFFEARVAETMWARVLGGVHYPTDTQAGRLMGRLIAAEMLKNPATLESIREARAEVMAFLETRPALVARAKFLTAACPPVPAAPPRDSLLVMSFNIRLKTPKDTGTRDWKARRGGVVEIARRHYPDLIGFQEALPEQVRFLSKELPEYACVAAGREGGGLGEAVPVFYKTRRFEALGSGHFWLSETPDVPGSKTPEWGARYPRMVTWARLRDKVTGRELCFASTHFSHVSDDARVHAARVVAERLGKAGDVSVILAGDFNAPSEPGVPPYDTLRDAGFLDTWTLAAARENAECGSFNGYGLKAPKTGAAPVRIDWILAKPAKGAALSVAKAAVLTERPGGGFASDHFPVAVRLSLE
jgi:endonuclease/exonuclease/phosphatase family metal-dependent hydrolase